MFQIFNLNFDNFYKKENSSKFRIIGILLLVLGVVSFLYKGFGIKIVSWTLAIALLFLAYLNLKNLNELKRYASKAEIAPYNRIQFFLLAGSVLLIIFPNKIQGFISLVLGLYIAYSQLIKLLRGKNNPYYRFTMWNLIVLVFGLTLVFSPFFLSNFIVSILSLIIILIGGNLLAIGNKIK
ncbi:hypothetical protein [Romboutsia lituseburensis]|uniref:hypothetical protein n=1 Tax=Romboutsia lituseburensis TaxID=1537 RepID=UPI0022EA8CEA|nr:hypothetical protein [Romboutsia lituseburensis]